MPRYERIKPLQVITSSELGSFRACPQQHAFAYIDLLRPKIEAPFFGFGRAFHAGIEASIRCAFAPEVRALERDERMRKARDAAEVATHVVLSEYERKIRHADDLHPERVRGLEAEALERVKLANVLLARQIDQTADDYEHLLPVAIERAFEVPVLSVDGARRVPVRLRGVIDAVWYDPDQFDLVVDDHKTTTKGVDYYTPKLSADPQLCGYLHATRSLAADGTLFDVAQLRTWGWPEDEITRVLQAAKAGKIGVGRVRYNVSRKKIPTEPRVLKDGTISAARIDTTAEVYEAAMLRQVERCLACGGSGVAGGGSDLPTGEEKPCKPCKGTGAGQQPSEEQRALLQSLRERPDTWFRRLEVWRTEDEIERWRRETVINAARIRSLARHPDERTRNLDHCTGPGGRCDYRQLCAETSMANEGPAEILALFRKAESAHEEWNAAQDAGDEADEPEA